MAEQLVRIGVPAVFDCGLTNVEERAIFTDWAEETGFSVRLHFVDVAAPIRWQRVERRNAERAETFQFTSAGPISTSSTGSGSRRARRKWRPFTVCG